MHLHHITLTQTVLSVVIFLALIFLRALLVVGSLKPPVPMLPSAGKNYMQFTRALNASKKHTKEQDSMETKLCELQTVNPSSLVIQSQVLSGTEVTPLQNAESNVPLNIVGISGLHPIRKRTGNN